MKTGRNKKTVFEKEAGAGLVEYGLIVLLVSLMAVSSLSLLSEDINFMVCSLLHNTDKPKEYMEAFGYWDSESNNCYAQLRGHQLQQEPWKDLELGKTSNFL